MWISLTYFREDGSRLREPGRYRTEKTTFFEIADEVREMLGGRRLPGLRRNHDFVFVLLETMGRSLLITSSAPPRATQRGGVA